MKSKIILLILLSISTYSMAQQVTLKGSDFYAGNERFYPMALNYHVDFVIKAGSYYLSPYQLYHNTTQYECNDPLSCLMQLQTDFNYLNGMGFNAIRVVGISPKYIQGGGLVSVIRRQSNANNVVELPLNPFNDSDPGMLTVLSLYDEILEEAHAASLKVILLLLGSTVTLDETEMYWWNGFFAAVSSHLNHSDYKDALLAYDIMNEPCYHIASEYQKTKQQACEIVSTWYDILKSNHPQGLVTIGSCGIGDIFSFDPSILKVDFHSLHYYPNFKSYEDRTEWLVQQSARIRTVNDLYWMQQNAIVPWIIGETSFSASKIYGISDGLYGTSQDQGNYVSYSLESVCNCGGSGYSWWLYQDASYRPEGDPDFGRGFYGLLEFLHAPEPAAEKQPAVNLFRNYPQQPQVTGACPVDYSPVYDADKLYYNPYGYPRNTQYEIESTVVDQDGNPIKDAVVSVSTYFGNDTIPAKYILNGVERDTIIVNWLGDGYYTHTDINGKFVAIPCATRYGFMGIGTVPTWQPYISQIAVSAAGAEVIKYGYEPTLPIWAIPNQIVLRKIKDNAVISGETVSNSQTETFKGRKTLIVSNTTVSSGGNATFTSAKTITVLPGFTAQAGSHTSMYIAPYGCSEWEFSTTQSPLFTPEGHSPATGEMVKNKEISLSFAKEFPENSISVFPNPANSTATVQLHSHNENATFTQIKLYDILGRTILTIPANNTSYVLDISNYPKGIYFIEVKDTASTYYQKIIIN